MEPLGGMDMEEVPMDIEERIGRLQLEYDRNAQAILDLNLLIEELENERTCRPRSFYRGEVKSIERNMRCAFCEAIGSHYSDSCWEVATARERRQLLADKKKCELCLEIICCGGKLSSLKKARSSCKDCKERGMRRSITGAALKSSNTKSTNSEEHFPRRPGISLQRCDPSSFNFSKYMVIVQHIGYKKPRSSAQGQNTFLCSFQSR
ncbi:unnamed protein product [Cylicocyclus nassatus]|uniref:Uncharacterized protein n=1 Tax=Cylicocyclus nassatus TaxID=53992 RepID=A0AA36GMJ4_CYLNA|nr:unnamed protein product [Cylicocyclus nassatus]